MASKSLSSVLTRVKYVGPGWHSVIELGTDRGISVLDFVLDIHQKVGCWGRFRQFEEPEWRASTSRSTE
jgi:hypothetical protein